MISAILIDGQRRRRCDHGKSRPAEEATPGALRAPPAATARPRRAAPSGRPDGCRPTSWAEPGKTSVMINSVHARRRLMRWLRCCGWCDEAGRAPQPPRCEETPGSPFGLLLRGRQGKNPASMCGARYFSPEATPTSGGVGTKAGDTPTGTFAICLRAAMRISIGFMGGSASQAEPERTR